MGDGLESKEGRKENISNEMEILKTDMKDLGEKSYRLRRYNICTIEVP